MSFPTGTPAFDRAPPKPSSQRESTPPSTDSTDSIDKPSAPLNPYRHILTHQEKKKQRMPKRKADSWPATILSDPDVLSLDDEGRFVLCKVCHVHYAVHGGKKPKPVIMNSSFRTRAWEVHKERTNSHRLHKKQDAPHGGRAVGGAVSGGGRGGNNATAPSSAAQQKRRVDEEHKNSDTSRLSSSSGIQPPPPPPPVLPRPPLQEVQNEQAPSRFGTSPLVAPLVPKPLDKQLAPSPRRRVARPPPEHAETRAWAPANREPPPRRPLAHDRVPPAPTGQPPMPGHNTPQLAMSSEQAEGLMRWRNMHDDVSRALGSSHKRLVTDAYDGGDVTPRSIHMADTEEFAGNNERVAKKLKSLDDEYDAKVLKRPEVYFDRRSDMYKQYWGTLRDVYNSANHHSSHAHPHARAHAKVGAHAHVNHSQNTMLRGANDFLHQQQAAAQSKESIDDFTTPDESGSSEEVVKPVVVHDQALINALDRLTGVISKQFSDRYTQETSLVLDAMGKLTNAVDDLRMDQGAAMNRIIQLQEQHLQVMQELLRVKLEKQRNRAAHVVGRSSFRGPGSSGSS